MILRSLKLQNRATFFVEKKSLIPVPARKGRLKQRILVHIAQIWSHKTPQIETNKFEGISKTQILFWRWNARIWSIPSQKTNEQSLLKKVSFDACFHGSKQFNLSKISPTPLFKICLSSGDHLHIAFFVKKKSPGTPSKLHSETELPRHHGRSVAWEQAKMLRHSNQLPGALANHFATNRQPATSWFGGLIEYMGVEPKIVVFPNHPF